MFKIPLPWFRKGTQPLSPSEVPKSFTMAGGDDNHLYKVSMENTYADFVDVDYKRLSYAEAAALSKHRKQTSRVSLSKNGFEHVARPTTELQAELEVSETDDEYLPEKFKTNNYFLKNKVYKLSDRNPKRKSL